MKILGLEIRRAPRQKQVGLTSVSGNARGGWISLIHEPFTGAFQSNQSISRDDVLTYSTVWSCITLIASDISKLWIKLLEKDTNGICTETESAAFSPVLRKPNRYQTRVKFFERWVISKLVYGNTYVLKERDARGVVSALYVLDPARVQVLVAPDGSVFYQLQNDTLAGVSDNAIVVPAREIIHDIHVPLYHDLVGVSPIHACGVAASQGLKIQNNTSKLFQTGTTLSGVLSTPHPIPPDTLPKLQKNWEANFQGQDNIGKVAIVGDDFKFTPMTMTAVDAQLIDQLKWGSEAVCACFHVPGYMVGIGPPPPYTDIQSINLQYYAQALQYLIENIEELLDQGLELPRAPRELHIEFDLTALARMDSKTQTEVIRAQIAAGFMTPNEGRAEVDRKPVIGGDSCYMQDQQHSLAWLKLRDDAGAPVPAPAPPTTVPAPTEPDQSATKSLIQLTDTWREFVANQKPEPVLDVDPAFSWAKAYAALEVASAHV